MIQCYYCGKTETQKSVMINHIVEDHNPRVTERMFGSVRNHQCEKCQMMFQSDSGLKMHTCGLVPPHWTKTKPLNTQILKK